MEFLKDQVIDYISRKKFVTLATSSLHGKPITHPVAYVNKDVDIYFSTSSKTRKAKNIKDNPNVAYSIYNETEFFDEIKAIQVEGIASIVSDKEEYDEVIEMLHKKFPFMGEMPFDSDSIVVKITPKKCYYSDYIKRYGSREIIEF